MNLGGTRWHNKYICDKCKKEIPFIYRKGFKDNLYHHYVSEVNRTAHKDFDLCKNCLTLHVNNFDESTFLWIIEKANFPWVPSKWNEIREK